jgi:hypothetical protein
MNINIDKMSDTELLALQKKLDVASDRIKNASRKAEQEKEKQEALQEKQKQYRILNSDVAQFYIDCLKLQHASPPIELNVRGNLAFSNYSHFKLSDTIITLMSTGKRAVDYANEGLHDLVDVDYIRLEKSFIEHKLIQPLADTMKKLQQTYSSKVLQEMLEVCEDCISINKQGEIKIKGFKKPKVSTSTPQLTASYLEESEE